VHGEDSSLIDNKKSIQMYSIASNRSNILPHPSEKGSNMSVDKASNQAMKPGVKAFD